MIQLTVDGREIEAKEGKSLLQVCLENGVTIPHLCYMEGMEEPPASCRLCFVEIAGISRPVPSCRTEPRDGMVVDTRSPAVRQLQRSALQLLLSAHRLDCRNCPSNKRCVLQQTAKFLGISLKVKHLDPLAPPPENGMNHPLLGYDPGKWVLRGKCIYVCEKQRERSLLTFVRRGFNTRVGFLSTNDAAEVPCPDCLACTEACPVSAFYLGCGEATLVGWNRLPFLYIFLLDTNK